MTTAFTPPRRGMFRAVGKISETKVSSRHQIRRDPDQIAAKPS